MDYSKLSDEELDRLVAEKQAKKSAKSSELESLSDEEIDKLVAQKMASMPEPRELPHPILDGTAPKTQTGPLESYALSAANKAAFGYLPQIIAKSQPIVDRAKGLLSNKMGPQAPMSQLTENGPEYIKARDEVAARIKLAEEEHPQQATAGNITGIVGMAPMLPALGIAKAGQGYAAAAKALELPKVAKLAGLLGRAGEAAAQGARIGLLSNPGDTEGKVDTTQLSQRITNAKDSAEMGLLLSGASDLVLASMKNASGAAKGIKDLGGNVDQYIKEKVASLGIPPQAANMVVEMVKKKSGMGVGTAVANKGLGLLEKLQISPQTTELLESYQPNWIKSQLLNKQEKKNADGSR